MAEPGQGSLPGARKRPSAVLYMCLFHDLFMLIPARREFAPGKQAQYTRTIKGH